MPICAAQVEPEHEYDYRDEGDYIPEYADYDQSLDQDDVDLTFATNMWAIAAERADSLEQKNRKMLQLPGSGTLLERVSEAPQRRLQTFARPTEKKTGGVKRERGPGKGGRVPQNVNGKPQVPAKAPAVQAPPIEDLPHPPYWNDDPCARWLGPSNVGYAYIDGHRERVLIDSGARANAITPGYCRQHKLKVRPVNELATNPTLIPVSGIGGFTQALGYAIINVRIEGIGSYNEEQVVLVIEDVSGLGMRVPVILGTPTIHRLCRQLKESEFETVPNEWQHALCCYEIAQQVPLNSMSVEPDETKYPTNTGQNPMDLDEQLILTDKVIIPAFSSQIIRVRTKKTYMIGHRLNVMMQLPYPEDKANLPAGLYIQRVYSDLKDGSQNLSTVVRNGTAKPIHLASGWIVGRVVATNAVPDVIISPELEEKLAKEDGEKPTPMTVEQRQELLMRVLTENGSIGKWMAWGGAHKPP